MREREERKRERGRERKGEAKSKKMGKENPKKCIQILGKKEEKR